MARRICFTIILILALAGPMAATTVRRLSFDELVSKAHSIVVGQVRDARTFWTADGKLILTSYTLQVRESMKGTVPSTVVVTTIGGRIGNTVLHVSGMPAFETGETAVVFLEQSGAYSTVLGLGQGKFLVSNDQVSNSVNGISFDDGTAGRPTKMPLIELKRQILLRVNR